MAHHDVLKALSSSDYGILWRNPSTTNVVASPTKLSEYNQAGLVVITNDGTSVSRVVAMNHLGICIDPKFQSNYPTMVGSAKVGVGIFDFRKKHFYSQLTSFFE